MVMADPSVNGDTPILTPKYETTVKNMFIVGELGGLALIKNAINQGRDCIDYIASRSAGGGASRSDAGMYDVVIVGAGPAGSQCFFAGHREKSQIYYSGRRRNRRYGGQISSTETGDDQSSRISDVRKIQEMGTIQGRIA